MRAEPNQVSITVNTIVLAINVSKVIDYVFMINVHSSHELLI